MANRAKGWNVLNHTKQLDANRHKKPLLKGWNWLNGKKSTRTVARG